MTTPDHPAEVTAAVSDGGVAIVHCVEAFTFNAGHRMRAAKCLICRGLVGGDPVTVVGAAALAGDACECGGIVSDVFLIHARHLPMQAASLYRAITRGLSCHNEHS